MGYGEWGTGKGDIKLVIHEVTMGCRAAPSPHLSPLASRLLPADHLPIPHFLFPIAPFRL
jgi:hypothetical protein